MAQSLFPMLQEFLIDFAVFPKSEFRRTNTTPRAPTNTCVHEPHSVFWLPQPHLHRTWDRNPYVRADRDCGLCPGVGCGPCGHRGGHCLHCPRPAFRWYSRTSRTFVSCTPETKVRIQICQSRELETQHRRKESGRSLWTQTWLKSCRRWGRAWWQHRSPLASGHLMSVVLQVLHAHRPEQKSGLDRWPSTVSWPSSPYSFSLPMLLVSPLLWNLISTYTSESSHTLWNSAPWVPDFFFSFLNCYLQWYLWMFHHVTWSFVTLVQYSHGNNKFHFMRSFSKIFPVFHLRAD